MKEIAKILAVPLGLLCAAASVAPIVSITEGRSWLFVAWQAIGVVGVIVLGLALHSLLDPVYSRRAIAAKHGLVADDRRWVVAFRLVDEALIGDAVMAVDADTRGTLIAADLDPETARQMVAAHEASRGRS